jgi:hypothetical protein
VADTVINFHWIFQIRGLDEMFENLLTSKIKTKFLGFFDKQPKLDANHLPSASAQVDNVPTNTSTVFISSFRDA